MFRFYARRFVLPALLFAIGIVLIQTETQNLDKSKDEETSSSYHGNKDDVQLDSWCFKPKGDDCTWYTECLAKYFKSERSSKESYALGFAVPICTGFTESWAEFSIIGQKWVNTTRACLQTKLVPLLSQDPSLTDQQVQAFAFNTHVACYTNPAPGDPGFCSLHLTDMTKIAWITKSAFAKQFSDSVALVMNIMKGCISNMFV